jgi:hypothetical protein
MKKDSYIAKINNRLKGIKQVFGEVGVFHEVSELVSNMLDAKMTKSGYISTKGLSADKIARFESFGGTLDHILNTIDTPSFYLNDAKKSFAEIDAYEIKKKRSTEPKQYSKKELITEANSRSYINSMHHDTLKNQYLSIMQMDEQLIDDVGTIQLEKLPYYLQALYQDYENTLGKGVKGKRSYTQMQKMYDTGATFVNAVKAWKEFNGKKI